MQQTMSDPDDCVLDDGGEGEEVQGDGDEEGEKIHE